MRSRLLIPALVPALFVAAAPAEALIVGTPGTTTFCAPLSCAAIAPNFQQAFDSSLFSGPTQIDAITFYNVRNPGSVPAGITFEIRFSTARFDYASLSFDMPTNVGADDQLFYAGGYTGTTTPSFTISGTPFVYDPADGDLLLQIRRTSADGSFAFYLDGMADGIWGVSYRYTANPDFYTLGNTFGGLSIGLQESAPGTGGNTGGSGTGGGGTSGGTGGVGGVPEPATWAMMIIGFGAIGLATRRRRTAQATA
jgi:uncharacterized membrane protein YgcG